jgi:hypothetical protein
MINVSIKNGINRPIKILRLKRLFDVCAYSSISKINAGNIMLISFDSRAQIEHIKPDI